MSSPTARPLSPAPRSAQARGGQPCAGSGVSRGPRRRAWRFQDGGGAGGVRRSEAGAARVSSPLSPRPRPRSPPRSRRDAEIHRLLPRHRLPLPHRRGPGRGPAVPQALLPLPAPPGGGGGGSAVRSVRRARRGGRARPRRRYGPEPPPLPRLSHPRVWPFPLPPARPARVPPPHACPPFGAPACFGLQVPLLPGLRCCPQPLCGGMSPLGLSVMLSLVSA